MDFPETFTVELVGAGLQPVDVAEILVALDIRVDGLYYYGTLIGLSDARGRTQTSRQRLENEFAEDRRLFPMDYRVDLSRCDSIIGVRIVGGSEFVESAGAAGVNAFLSSNTRMLWDRAKNRKLRSVTLDIDLTVEDRRAALVTIPVLAA